MCSSDICNETQQCMHDSHYNFGCCNIGEYCLGIYFFRSILSCRFLLLFFFSPFNCALFFRYFFAFFFIWLCVSDLLLTSLFFSGNVTTGTNVTTGIPSTTTGSSGIRSPIFLFPSPSPSSSPLFPFFSSPLPSRSSRLNDYYRIVWRRALWYQCILRNPQYLHV